MMPKAALITVNYGSALTIKRFLANLSRANAFSDLAVIIVDNSSDKKDVANIHEANEKFSNVEVLESATNLGYFGAARFAFDHYLMRGQSVPDWVIVCNHDVIVEDGDFFAKLFAHDPSAAGVIAPRIQIRESGVDQNPFMRRRPSRLRWGLYKFAKSSYWTAVVWEGMSRVKRTLKSPVARSVNVSNEPTFLRSEPIYAAHGAFFIFSRRYFEAGGYLDGNLFLYGEEISVAELCRSLKLPVIYVPSLRVIHNEHESTGRIVSRSTYDYERKALQYVTSRYLSGSKELTESKS